MNIQPALMDNDTFGMLAHTLTEGIVEIVMECGDSS